MSTYEERKEFVRRVGNQIFTRPDHVPESVTITEYPYNDVIVVRVYRPETPTRRSRKAAEFRFHHGETSVDTVVAVVTTFLEKSHGY